MKKVYEKPKVVEVKLTIQNPILGLCEDTGVDPQDGGVCSITPANCQPA